MGRKTSMESLSEIVTALLKNSLDANSSSIAIRICLELFWLQVLDNGDGINGEDLRSIGNSCLLNIDFEKKKPTKRFARLTSSSLSEIIGKCEEILIESVDGGAPTGAKPNSRLFKQASGIGAGGSQQLRNFQSVSQYHYTRSSRGTTVTLKNIFYDEPQRQRDRSIQQDYRRLLVDLRLLALIHYDRSFSLQDLTTSEVVFRSKKLTALLPKYCELYDLKESDVDVTTCRKDNILAECFFSRREARQALEPVQVTFVNQQPTDVLPPIVNEVLTQHQQTIDYLIVVTFPNNELLTQQNEPIVRNCLSRCLKQYRICLERRRKPTSAVVKGPNNSHSRGQHSSNFPKLEDMSQPDEEDILYGLSQPGLSPNNTFRKCSEWLQTNIFDIPVKKEKHSNSDKSTFLSKADSKSEARQKIDFFGKPPAIPHVEKRRKDEPMTIIENKPPNKLPLPKFYPVPTKKIIETSPVDQRGPRERKGIPPKPVRAETRKQPRQERDSFLNIALDPDDRLSFFQHVFPVFSTKKKQCKENNTPPASFDVPSSLGKIVKQSKRKIHESHAQIGTFNLSNICFEDKKETAVSPPIPSIRKSCSIPNRKLLRESKPIVREPAQCDTLPNLFVEPLFLHPPPLEDDRYALNSPRARYYENDLLKLYENFHRTCWETIQHYRLAIEGSESESDRSDGCRCCSRSPRSRQMEILRQPFHCPRDIFANIRQ